MKNDIPAFPRPASEYTASGTLPDGNDAIRAQEGMTLRDYFAGQALAGFADRWQRELTGFAEADANGALYTAKLAYQIADAMVAVQEETTRVGGKPDSGDGARGATQTKPPTDPARVILERLLRHMIYRDGHYRVSNMAVARARREAGLDEDGSVAPSPPDDIRAALEAVANFSREDFTDGRPNGIWLVGESVVRQARRALGRPE